MKTPIQYLVNYLNKGGLLKLNEISAKELDDLVTDLLEEEKRTLCDFWIEGNRQGWTMQTDWPEDAEAYYDSKFKPLEAKS